MIMVYYHNYLIYNPIFHSLFSSELSSLVADKTDPRPERMDSIQLSAPVPPVPPQPWPLPLTLECEECSARYWVVDLMSSCRYSLKELML